MNDVSHQLRSEHLEVVASHARDSAGCGITFTGMAIINRFW